MEEIVEYFYLWLLFMASYFLRPADTSSGKSFLQSVPAGPLNNN